MCSSALMSAEWGRRAVLRARCWSPLSHHSLPRQWKRPKDAARLALVLDARLHMVAVRRSPMAVHCEKVASRSLPRCPSNPLASSQARVAHPYPLLMVWQSCCPLLHLKARMRSKNSALQRLALANHGLRIREAGYKHTCRHVKIQTQTHRHTQTHTDRHRQTQTDTDTDAHVRAHAQIQIRTQIHPLFFGGHQESKRTGPPR